MKENTLSSIICLILLLSSLLTTVNIPSVRGNSAISLQVTQMVWGQDVNTPTEAFPGDTNVPLTIEVQNYSNETIKGVQATLMLKHPFTDTYGKYNVTATGNPTVVGNVMNQTGEILAGGFFTLAFRLNVDSKASIKSYQYNMTVKYLVKVGSLFVKGEDKTLSATLVLSKASTTITCSASPQQIERGEYVDVSGTLNPVHENTTITILYKKPDGSTLNRLVRTAADSSYRDSYQPDIEGTWSVNASWIGDIGHKEGWASASFEVMFPVSLDILTSNTRMIGGLDNALNITLANTGETSLSSIDMTFTISSPIVLHGDNEWTVKYLEPKNSVIIPLRIYPPSSAIGATYQGQIQLNYRDDYGQSHSKTYPLGLIIVGRVELIVYGKTVTSQPSPGSKATLSATILNKGNTKAMYANATILPNPVLELLDESTTYIGEIEENSPMPFTVLARVNSNAENGTYPIKIVVSYRDDQYKEHSLNFTINLTVAKSQSGQSNPSSSWDLRTFLVDNLLVILTLLGASVVTIIIYKLRFSRRGIVKTIS